jgi:hypothetical protein
MEADLARRRWNSFVIISGESLQAPVGHLRGDQFFSEKTFIDSQRQSFRTRAMSLTHHSLMKIFRRIAANELLGERKKPSMETGGNQKTYSHFLSHLD